MPLIRSSSHFIEANHIAHSSWWIATVMEWPASIGSVNHESMGLDPVVFHRERFRRQSVAKSARAQAWNDASLLQRMAMSPVSAQQAVAVGLSGAISGWRPWQLTPAVLLGRGPVRSHPMLRSAQTLRAAGHSWKQCSDMTMASYRNLQSGRFPYS